MKAFLHRRFGGPDVMTLEDVAVPPVRNDGVLVRVRASSVNAYDWHMLRGQPYMARVTEGFRHPKDMTTGADVAGVVEAVGADVSHLAIGDHVFGSRGGAFAEYVSGRTFVSMPANVTFEEAAALPVAGCTALQAVRDRGGVTAGQRVLVTGAGGGVGTFAVQIAKAYGASVTAVTSGAKADVVRSIGADEVLDHRSSIVRGDAPYDVILDVSGRHSLGALRRALTPGGRIVMVAPGAGNWAGPLLRIGAAWVRSRLGGPSTAPFLAHVTRDDLDALRGLVETGAIRPVIDRTYPFDRIPDAIRDVESGRVAGKVVISI